MGKLNNKTLHDVRLIAGGYRIPLLFISAIKTDLFSIIKDGNETPKAIARKLGTTERAVKAVLRALASVGLLKKKADRYLLTQLTQPLADDQILRNSLLHTAEGVERWNRLDRILCGTKKQKAKKRQSDKRKRLKNFIATMEVSSRMRADRIARAIEPLLKKAKRMLDLGGGSGGYTKVFIKNHPQLHATIFERRQVIPITKEHLGDTNGRINFIAGDFLKDPIGQGYDLAFLSSIIHIYPAETNRKLLKKIFRAIRPRGHVVISDFFLNNDEISPQDSAIFGVHMLTSTEGGGTYTIGEVKNWLQWAGFIRPRCLTSPNIHPLIIAQTPTKPTKHTKRTKQIPENRRTRTTR